ncbi:MAG: TraB/GumN family protein [Pseudomonadota bacterium]|nr:TraB/GumN family protein [Pseudomonadota bacterium]
MLLSLLLVTACAPKLPAGGASAPENPLLLWRVERAGQVSHLLGTCHMGVDLDYALPAPHDAALTQARVVYTEAALDLDDPARIVGLLWNEGPGLSTRISDERWRAVAIAVRDTLPAPLFEHMEPWALAMIVPMVTADGMKAFDGTGMDLEIQTRAKTRGIRSAYVETIEEQAAMLGAWNDAFLESLGPTEATDSAEGAALDALCMRADTSVADVILQADDPTSEALLSTRNHAWMPKLLPELAEGGAFVAVGAAHMLGDDGLLHLLAAEGYSVTQLTSKRPVSKDHMPTTSAAIPPAPPRPADLDKISRLVAEGIAPMLCAEGQVVRTCFEPDQARCTERLLADAELCVRQNADLLPEGGAPMPPGVSQKIAACVPTGIVMEAIGNDRIGEGPVCDLMKAAMKGAGGK